MGLFPFLVKTPPEIASADRLMTRKEHGQVFVNVWSFMGFTAHHLSSSASVSLLS